MEKLSLENIEKYIVLNNELAFEDPYVLKITKDEFLEKHTQDLKLGCIDIFILSNNKEDIGFVELSKDVDTVIIEEIYVRKQYNNYNAYKSMLEFVHKCYCDSNIRRVKFIGVNDKADLIEGLKDIGYRMEKEHIQMEKIISKLSKRNLTIDYRTFYEIGDEKWIYNFMEKCMEGSNFSYKVEEINELIEKNSDLIFVLYENNQPIGFIISYINEKRNKQQNMNVIYIEEIAILKEFRNKGYGFRVIESVLNKGKNSGMDIARLHVYRHNEKAYRLYEKIGFNEIKSIGHWNKILGI
ncbi:GNAT family N-acetyltransferase [Oceanirhabdus seepicola]|uniref:GNAT family N-acetyltransferase n=1 Tax=Oceanirhabdus seepicola TaxID=2828781 RepID=A0A9J6NY84_9CLOT|nr:GNAT family N-acetyltransferase [Oceanirhabdus seepicola]MCM1989402.1 GNAT family N-acetyltransferase [Oceanirhabdus seepicola]